MTRQRKATVWETPFDPATAEAPVVPEHPWWDGTGPSPAERAALAAAMDAEVERRVTAFTVAGRPSFPDLMYWARQRHTHLGKIPDRALLSLDTVRWSFQEGGPGAADEVAYGWMVLLLAATTDTYTSVYRVASGPNKAAAAARARWAALGTLGPLAWVAGLPLREAKTGIRTGALTADRLLVLAGLRGRVLPPGAFG